VTCGRVGAALVVALWAAAGARADGGAVRCPSSGVATVLTSPATPRPGAPLRVLAASEQPLDATLTVAGPDGAPVAVASERQGGTPYWWSAEVASPRAGTYRVTLVAGADVVGCAVAVVGDGAAPRTSGSGVWPVTRAWDRATEALYSAWVEKLFDDPVDAEPAWHALHEATRDPARNLLHDHLGLGEDDPSGLVLEPDCADLPYFLRAYFSWKLGLPFGFSECSRGGEGRPPRCTRWHSASEPPPDGGGTLARVQAFFARRLAWVVQSGAGRAPADDDRTDLYPTPLSVAGLRPGTVYADPYGHTLVVVHRVPETATAPGLLLAVDAQPDGTVARKRYWRGNFLFALDPTLGSPGFKRFRPVDARANRPLTNREILASPDYGDWSLEQYAAGVDGFYDHVDDVLSPTPLDPARVFAATIDALGEQVGARVRSVANGETWKAAHRGAVIAMPDGAQIFETTGPWEDFATPSRDLRLLIALDVVRSFPAKVAARPERFALPADRPVEAVRADLEAQWQRDASARSVSYVRSDGSPWTLTLADVMARAEALEMAWNPNDCVEVRWGAPADGPERATCVERAPAPQEARMAAVRDWFHQRRRPPR